jgi:WD40 repeat protein
MRDGSPAGKADPGDYVDSMAISTDGQTLALGTLYGGIFLWNMPNGSVSKTIKPRDKTGPSPGAIYGLALSADGRTIASGSSLGGIQIWSADGGSPHNMRDASGTTVRRLAFSPRGSTLIYSKYNDNSVWIWRMGGQPYD